MDLVLVAAGIAVLAVVSVDFLMSTVGSSSRIALTPHIGRAAFEALRLLSRVLPNRLLTEVSGVAVMVCVAAFWIGGAWLGWSLIYAGGGGIEMTRVGATPEPVDHASHVGHLLSTLGGATTQPAGQRWNLMGVLVGLNGMVMLTLAVSFLLAVRETVKEGRVFAALVQTGPHEIDRHLPRLAELVAGLHAAPHALWYGHLRRERRLPDALLLYARQAERAGGPLAARVRDLLRDLPHFAEDGGPFLEALERWRVRHTLAEEAEPGGDGHAAVA